MQDQQAPDAEDAAGLTLVGDKEAAGAGDGLLAEGDQHRFAVLRQRGRGLPLLQHGLEHAAHAEVHAVDQTQAHQGVDQQRIPRHRARSADRGTRSRGP
jgi:hypothetical protein